MNTAPLLILVRHSPYGSSLGKVSLDTALAAAAFEQPLNVLYMGDGVLQLLPGQQGDLLGGKTLSRQIASFPLYDIEKVYVEATAAERYGLEVDAAPLPVELVGHQAIRDLMAGSGHILSF